MSDDHSDHPADEEPKSSGGEDSKKPGRKAAKKKTARKDDGRPSPDSNVGSEAGSAPGTTADRETQQASTRSESRDEPEGGGAKEDRRDRGREEASGGDDAASDSESTAKRVSARRISNKPRDARVSDDDRAAPGSGDADAGGEGDQIAVISEPPGPEEKGGGNKRRRRRRKKSGSSDESDRDETQGGSPQRPSVDPSKVARKAWRIFLAEVSEEGLALISDQDAKELSRRSFRLAEIFLEEASRRQ